MLQDEKSKALQYFNEHGYLVVSNQDQRNAAEELVKEGCLIHPKPEWMGGQNTDTFFVSPSVTNKHMMPAILHKIVYPDEEYRKGEIVMVKLYSQYHKQEITVQGKIETLLFKRQDWNDPNKPELEKVEVSISNGSYWFPLNYIEKTS